MTFRIAVIYGSVRSNRQGIKVARFIVRKLKQRGHEVELIDPMEYKLPLLDKMYKEYEEGKVPKVMEKVANILDSSDGFVVVTGEYNHGTPPALKNLLDHFQKQYFFKPASIACYSKGPFGGVREAIHLRAVLGELGMVSTPSFFPVTFVRDAFDEEGNAIEKAYNRRIKRFLDEFEWYVMALKQAREEGTPY
jgi:NAD(P)H-dependent FMN reductase